MGRCAGQVADRRNMRHISGETVPFRKNKFVIFVVVVCDIELR